MASRRKLRTSRFLGPALGAGFSAGATALGYGTAAPIAYNAGQYIGNLIKTYTGFGEYKVQQNVLYEGAQAPYVRNHDYTNGTLISHKEYIMDVVTSSTAGAFKVQNFYLNPGLAIPFEFLAQIAANYEQYVWEGVIFTFRSMSADALNSVNTALGTVVMATNYNVYNGNFSNKAEMEAYEYSMSGKPSENLMHPIECDPSRTPIDMLYTRTGSYPSNSDKRMYDLGNFQIATVGFQGTEVNIGELWVSYQVALLKPRLYASLGYTNDYWHGHSTDCSIAWCMGQTFTTYALNNIDVTWNTAGNNLQTFYLPAYPMPTSYCIITYTAQAAANCPTVSYSVLTNCAFDTSQLGVARVQGPNDGLPNTTHYMQQAFIRTVGNTLVPSITFNHTSGVATAMDVYFIQVPNSIV